MSPQAGWILQEEVAPRLRASIPRNVSHVGAEDDEELVQDSICLAAKFMDRAEQLGKQVTPGNTAYYTILHMRCGRRSYGISVTDACAVGTQFKNRSRLNSMDEPVNVEENGEVFTVNDVFSTDQEDPSQIAARKMDWEAFCAGLSAREQAVVEALMAGRNLGEVAVRFGVSLSTIQSCKNRLAEKVLEFMGPDIMTEIRRVPGWRHSLDTNREQAACRHDRRS